MKVRLRGTLVGCSLLLCSLLHSPGAGAQHFPADAELRLMLRYIVEDTGTPGLVLGIREADGATRIVSYGSAGRRAQPLGPTSRFQIGSITKTFTAALLADMAARGEVALDDPVARYLPEHVRVSSRDGREVTLLDLATHTSGLPTWPMNLSLRGNDPLANYTVEDLYAFLSTHQPWDVPGSEYRYSNVGYGLLAHALARAAGRSYRDLLRERIFEPLGMHATDLPVAEELGESMVVGHRRGLPVPLWFATEAMQGAAGVLSTAEDLLRFLDAQVGSPGTELERAMRVAQEVRVPDGDRGAGWGFSWRTGAFPDGTLIRGHGGAESGYRARITFVPDRQLGVVVLANDYIAFNEDLETMLLYLEPPAAGRVDAPVDQALLARYTGTYAQQDDESEHFVRLEDEGHLTHQPSDGVRTRLYATSDTTFYTLRGPWTFTFRPDVGAEGATMVIAEDERSRNAERTTRTAVRVSGDTPPAGDAGSRGAPAVEREGRWGWGMIGLVVALVVAAAVGLLWMRRT